jgi:hypothetical protein
VFYFFACYKVNIYMETFDLYKKIKQDPSFFKNVISKLDRLEQIESRGLSSSVSRDSMSEAVMELLKLCDYNSSLLVPHFFPAYPYQEPLSLFNRPFAFAMMDLQLGGSTTIRASRQIGKSSTLGVRQLMNARMIPNYRSMMVVPHPDHKKTYANRLRELEQAIAFPITDRNYRQNLNYKEFPNGSIIELIHVWMSATNARGKTCDELLLDEVQNFDPELLPEVQQTQKASQFPVTIYAGTSLTIETLLETNYQDSSRATWHVRSPARNKLGESIWLDTGDKETALKIIKPRGPTCPYTGRILDMTDGEFVHADLKMLRAGYKGFHIPQIIIQEFVDKATKWQEIWKAYVDYSESKFLQEVLGIPTEEGAREITIQDLQSICMPDENPQSLKDKANKGYYKHVISGVDWGGSDYNAADRTKVSYTVHVICGVLHNGSMEILHMRQYSGTTYDEIGDQICRDHKDYGASYLGTDFGGGAVYHYILHNNPNINPSTHFIFDYTGPRTAPLAAPKKSALRNMYMLNRTESISQLYLAIKQDPSIIRCYNWAIAEARLKEMLNLYRIPVENNHGGAEYKYQRHGSKPDDTLHALNYCHVLKRLLLGEPLVEDRTLRDQLLQQLRAGAALRTSNTGMKLPGVYSG